MLKIEMDSLLCLLLLLHCPAVTVSQSCSQEGAVEIIGTVTPTLIAGRLEICMRGQWRAVYSPGWDITEARAVCRQKGFPPENAIPCTGSCFGQSPLTTDGYYFICEEENTTLLECPKYEIRRCCCYGYRGCSYYDPIHRCCPPEFAIGCKKYCYRDAGVVCTQPIETAENCSSTFDVVVDVDMDVDVEMNETERASNATPTTPPEPLPRNICTDDMFEACIETLSEVTTNSVPNTPGGVASSPKGVVKSDTKSTNTIIESSCRTTKTALGIALVIAVLTLVGVVTAWVWFCQRTKLTAKQQSLKADQLDALENPQYTPVHPFVQYSTLSPGDRPIIGRAPLLQPEAEYQEVRDGPQSLSSDDSSVIYDPTPAPTYSKLQRNLI